MPSSPPFAALLSSLSTAHHAAVHPLFALLMAITNELSNLRSEFEHSQARHDRLESLLNVSPIPKPPTPPESPDIATQAPSNASPVRHDPATASKPMQQLPTSAGAISVKCTSHGSPVSNRIKGEPQNEPVRKSRQPDITPAMIEHQASTSTPPRKRDGKTAPTFLAAAQNTPVAKLNTPLMKFDTPAAKFSTPATKLSTPATKLNTPAIKLNTPATKLNTPATKLSTPATKLSTPATKLNTPVTKPSPLDMTGKKTFSATPDPNTNTTSSTAPSTKLKRAKRRSKRPKTPITLTTLYGDDEGTPFFDRTNAPKRQRVGLGSYKSPGAAVRAAEAIVRARTPDVKLEKKRASCVECERFIRAEAGGDQKQYEEMVDKACRHKGEEEPHGYWDLTFNETETQPPRPPPPR